jgi:hypothetical protein
VGRFWTSTPNRTSLRLTNACWAMAFLRRLGIQERPHKGCCCQLRDGGNGNLCGKPLDHNLCHPAICEAGGGRQRAHRAVCALLFRLLKAAGAHVEPEKVIPELYVRHEDGRIAERRMDLEVRWPSGKRHLLDVTIRSPFAQDIPQDAMPGLAAERGEEDKKRHYGESVSTIAIEPAGRMGVAALGALAQLARDASNLSAAMPGTCKAGCFRVATARADIEAEVARCEASRVLASLGGEAAQALGWATARAQQGGTTDSSAIRAPAAAGCKPPRQARPQGGA